MSILKINNSLHLARKYARIFVRGHYLFREANSFPRAMLEENCELRGTDNVQGQTSAHIFAPNGDYCLYYPSNLLRNARSFENWGIFNNYNPPINFRVILLATLRHVVQIAGQLSRNNPRPIRYLSSDCFRRERNIVSTRISTFLFSYLTWKEIKLSY